MYLLNLKGPLRSEDLKLIIKAVERGMDDVISGDDSRDEEARLKHTLSQAPEKLELFRMEREFPAYRLGETLGMIDFLGVDSREDLHVVEAKLGNDPMLALQGLDYWVYATAHHTDLCEKLEVKQRGPVHLDFVCGPKGTSKPIGPYTENQLEAFDGSIPWRFHIAKDWRTGVVVTSARRRNFPTADATTACGPPRYSTRLRQHLLAHEAPKLARPGSPLYSTPGQGIVEGARRFWDDLDQRGALHRWANSVTSSQAFAVNLFGSLGEDGLRSLLGDLGVDAKSITGPTFEFEDTDDLLREATAMSSRRTQVDVAARTVDASGHRTLLAVEVKLTEEDFSHCSGYKNPRNDHRDVCLASGAFGNDTDACFLLRNYGREHRRRYDLALGPLEIQTTGCAFRLGLSQPMRSVAMLESMVSDGSIDNAIYALTAPREHTVIWRRWEEAKAAFATSQVRPIDLPADNVAAYLPAATADLLRRRYRL